MLHHPSKTKLLALALLGSAWLVAASAAPMYKWTDADGKIHYSDQPPPASVKEGVTVKPGKQSAPVPKAAAGEKAVPTAKAKTYVEEEAEFRKRKVEEAEREAAEKKKAEDAAQQKQNCERARAQLANLQAGGRLTRINAQGEREFLSDAEIAQAAETAKKSADSWCK